MPARKQLRAVAPDERAGEAVLSITDAADKGTPRQLLVAMRSRIAKTVEDPNCPARDLSSLSKRLQEINRDIDALDVKVKQEGEESAGHADAKFDASAI